MFPKSANDHAGPSLLSSSGPVLLLQPLALLFVTTCYIPITVVHLILTLNLRPLTSFSAFKDAWFARHWQLVGAMSRGMFGPAVVPLISRNASGVCLDIGPGGGDWLFLFNRAENPQIKKIYGVEPNTLMHPKLRENVAKAGLQDIYEVVGCGVEDLQTKAGFKPGSMDTIITVQCLCSIPTPERVINELAPLLKSGGKWLFFEHVRTKYQGQLVDRWSQAISFVWPQFFNGCDIRRPTDHWLLQSTEWKDVQIEHVGGGDWYDATPHIVGALTKK